MHFLLGRSHLVPWFANRHRFDMKILVLGIGNTLLSDEGAGVAAMNALRVKLGAAEDIEFLDGGTLSFTLAVPIADCDALLVFDAAMLDGPPGTWAAFEGEAMDRFLGEKRRFSVHEVGLLDLMAMARLAGDWPARRCLVAVRPEKLDWGEVLTPAVAAALPAMCDAAARQIADWRRRASNPVDAAPDNV
jgi:hydrogenase maturation protease